MTMGYTGPPNEWIRSSVDKLKQHLAELHYSEGTIFRLDATWKELIAYCEEHNPPFFYPSKNDAVTLAGAAAGRRQPP